jgi:hypothetical protein
MINHMRLISETNCERSQQLVMMEENPGIMASIERMLYLLETSVG